MPAPRLATVIVNAERPERLVAFWSAFLQTSVAMEADGITWLAKADDTAVGLGIQRVEHKLATHTDTHLDFVVDDLDAAQRQVEGLGGGLVAVHRLESGFEWRVMRDPDRNEFCIFVH